MLLKQTLVNLYTKKHNKQIKTDKAWYLASVFLIGLAVLAVFYMKGKHHSSNNPNIDAKNPSHKNYKKNDNNRSKSLNP
ncbi:hypothetical protein KVK75_07835 [Helicobacter pylori]|nr:hypothetical protein KVK75_07835 [Helicobacter pylori]